MRAEPPDLCRRSTALLERGLQLNADGLEQLKHRLACDRGVDPDERPRGIDLSVENEDEPAGREKQWKRCTQRVAAVISNVEVDDEIAADGPLEADAEE